MLIGYRSLFYRRSLIYIEYMHITLFKLGFGIARKELVSPSIKKSKYIYILYMCVFDFAKRGPLNVCFLEHLHRQCSRKKNPGGLASCCLAGAFCQK